MSVFVSTGEIIRAMLREFLFEEDAGRAARAVEKLRGHDLSRWALTGGFAIEIRAPGTAMRRLNDLDFVVSSFDHIPAALGRDFLFRHVHPDDPPGKLVAQMIDPDTSLRIDVFRATDAILSRADGGVVSLHDLTARCARLMLDLAEGVPVPITHARDFERLAAVANAARVETVWQDHRKPAHPWTFSDAAARVHALISERSGLLIEKEYSHDPNVRCLALRITGHVCAGGSEGSPRRSRLLLAA